MTRGRPRTSPAACPAPLHRPRVHISACVSIALVSIIDCEWVKQAQISRQGRGQAAVGARAVRVGGRMERLREGFGGNEGEDPARAFEDPRHGRQRRKSP